MGNTVRMHTARYLKRAAELRAAADRIDDHERVEALRRAADAYERMAQWDVPEPMFGQIR